MVDLNYPQLLDSFREHLDSKRSESASFLIWYLEKYYRLSPLEAVDSVCDQPNDKGVDGLYINDADQTITIFQSKISQKSASSIGDASLRSFAGTLGQFSSVESVKNLVDSAGSAQVADLIKRTDLIQKIPTHDIRGEFIVNLDIDQNGIDYLKGNPQIEFIGKSKLTLSYISDKRDLPVHSQAKFDILGFDVTKYVVDATRQAVIAPIKATELVKLEGIEDQSIFAYNVRGPLGKTNINKSIVKSIKDSSKHKLFPLFHNGITIIAGILTQYPDNILVDEYYVVNGCQSLSALYANKSALSDDLRILTKFIQMDPSSPEASIITAFSNNQNGVRPRDFKANTQPQIRLQNEFSQHYSGQYSYEIKRGEVGGTGTPISNEEAGLFLMAFDLKEPWATHRKYQVFEDKHDELFARPEVTADRIVMCQVIIEAIRDQIPKLANQLFGRHVLTQYTLLYIIREILDRDPLAPIKIKDPSSLVREIPDRQKFKSIITQIAGDIINDLNEELREYGDDFNYRDRLREQSWVNDMRKKIVSTHVKLISRGYVKSFQTEWAP